MKTQIVLTCLKCGKKWIKKYRRNPVSCPACRSLRWNREKLPSGPRVRYDLSLLDKSPILIVWQDDMSGWLGAIRRLKKKKPGIFSEPRPDGLLVWDSNRQGDF